MAGANDDTMADRESSPLIASTTSPAGVMGAPVSKIPLLPNADATTRVPDAAERTLLAYPAVSTQQLLATVVRLVLSVLPLLLPVWLLVAEESGIPVCEAPV